MQQVNCICWGIRSLGGSVMFDEKEYQKEYRLKNKEKGKEYIAKYYLEHREKILARTKEWQAKRYKKHPKIIPVFTGYKVCLSCKGNKLLSEFCSHRGRTFGKTDHCRECLKKHRGLYYLNHRERILQLGKERYRKYYSSGEGLRRDQYLQTQKKWQELNREKVSGIKKKWEKLNLAHKNQYHQEKRESLADVYVRSVLHVKRGLCYKLITPELIQMKREQLKLFRNLKKLKEVYNESDHSNTEGIESKVTAPYQAQNNSG